MKNHNFLQNISKFCNPFYPGLSFNISILNEVLNFIEFSSFQTAHGPTKKKKAANSYLNNAEIRCPRTYICKY